MAEPESFLLAVRVWQADGNAAHPTPRAPIFPPPLSVARMDLDPLDADARRCLDEGRDPSFLWAAQEKGHLSAELRACNEADAAALTIHAARFDRPQWSPDLEINRRVRLSTVFFYPVGDLAWVVSTNPSVVCVDHVQAFWLSHRHVSAVTVSANEALQGGGGQVCWISTTTIRVCEWLALTQICWNIIIIFCRTRRSIF